MSREKDIEKQEATASKAVTPQIDREKECHPFFTSANLPYRTPHLIQQERDSFETMVSVIRREGKDDPAARKKIRLTVGELVDVVLKYEAEQFFAAYLIGRCRTGGKEDTYLNDILRMTIKDGNAPTDVRIEAAFSIVLSGERALGQRYLEKEISPDSRDSNAYKAAFFLAQMGNPAGWRHMKRSLNDSLSHYRGMATRHLIAFLPFNGQKVDGVTIDVYGAMAAMLKEPDAMVRMEAPFHLEDINHPDLIPLLQQVLKNDPDKDVRIAAKIVLDRASGQPK